MGSKGFIKGLAAGAVLGAVAAVVHSMGDNKDEKASELKKAALKIKNRVAKRALEVGKMSKTAYGKIVDVTVDEFRGLKSLSEEELKEMRDELKESWVELEGILNKKSPAKKPIAKKK